MDKCKSCKIGTLIKTENDYIEEDSYGIDKRYIFICENCKRYYINTFGEWFEIYYNHDLKIWVFV